MEKQKHDFATLRIQWIVLSILTAIFSFVISACSSVFLFYDPSPPEPPLFPDLAPLFLLGFPVIFFLSAGMYSYYAIQIQKESFIRGLLGTVPLTCVTIIAYFYLIVTFNLA